MPPFGDITIAAPTRLARSDQTGTAHHYAVSDHRCRLAEPVKALRFSSQVYKPVVMESDAPKGLALLADPTRRALVAALATNPMPVCDLVLRVGASQPSISRHLRLLREAGVVDVLDSLSDRRLRVYRLRRDAFIEIEAWLAQVRGDWHRQQIRASPNFIPSAHDLARQPRAIPRRPLISPPDPKPPRTRRKRRDNENQARR